jgi:hypothetical protein
MPLPPRSIYTLEGHGETTQRPKQGAYMLAYKVTSTHHLMNDK